MSTSSTNPVKEEPTDDVDDDGEYVTLTVQHQNKPDFLFKMKRDDPIRKLMIKFCERMKFGDYRQIRFTLDGARIKGDHTPNKLELENGDSIDAWSEQLGAGLIPTFRFCPPNCSI